MLLEVEDARLSRGGEEILCGIDFSFDCSRVMSILGPNGAGKTTFLKALLGFLVLDSGSITFDGRKVSEIPARSFWRATAYVPQAKPQILQRMSLSEFVVLGRTPHLGFFSLPSRSDWRAVDEALDKVGLFADRRRMTTEVSGGQLQLALIARALAQNPSLLVLDEPESNLDFKNQKIVFDVLKSLKDAGYGVILNTHFPHHAYLLSDDVLLMRKRRSPVFGSRQLLHDAALLCDVFDADVELQFVDIAGEKTPFVTVA